MYKSGIIRRLLPWLTALLLLGMAQVGLARDPYVRILPPQPTETGDKIEVREVFWYTCPHCYGFKNYLDKWLENKPDDVEVVYMPAVYPNLRWVEYAKAFYTAKVMGVLDQVHGPMFKALHDEKRRFKTEDDFADFFAEQGVDREEFKKTYSSFAVDNMIREAMILTARYGVSAVPTIIVNGKYRLLGSRISGHANMLKEIDKLIAKERRLAKRQAEREAQAREEKKPDPSAGENP